MFLRALTAFLILPGLFAFMLPPVIGMYDPWRHDAIPFGGVIIILGIILLIWCVRDFYVSGRGTLAPWDPPRRLVVIGLYRFVRNPMYVSVLTLVLGWAITFASPVLAGYAVVLAVSFHIRVIVSEEPCLAAQFGSEWQVYAAAVNRWWPRLSPWRSSS